MSAEEVMRLIAKRTEFLKEHPDLQSLQEKIDLELKKAGKNPLNRCTVIQKMMLDELGNLNDKIKELLQEMEKL